MQALRVRFGILRAARSGSVPGTGAVRHGAVTASLTPDVYRT